MNKRMEFTLAGLHIDSDIALPGLAEPDGTAEAFGFLRIRQIETGELASRRNMTKRHPEFALTIAGTATFLVTGPSEILIAPHTTPLRQELFGYLLGPCFAAIAWLNGILPFHAGTIDTPSGCVALAGQSGSGKSTLVNALRERGYPVRSDDVCFLRRTVDGRVLVWSGIRQLRLVTLQPAQEGSPVYPKKRLTLPPLVEPAKPLSLRSIYLLDRQTGEQDEEIVRLFGARAAEQVIGNAYRIQIATLLGRCAQAVPNCVAVANGTAVYRYRRTMGLDAIPEALHRLCDHFASVGRP